MGFGSFGHGGSSLSSNLSPLAQPFAVDRYLPNPNLAPFAEDPYSYSHLPSFENWLHLHPPTSVSDPFPNPRSVSELDSTRATNLSCAGNYGYFGSQSISSFGPQQPNTATSSIGYFPYDLPQAESSRTTLVEAMPYYPQNPSSASHDDSNPIFLNDSGCNMISASSFAPSDETYQAGYTRNFPVGYTGCWSGFCDGLAEEEQARRKGLDGNLFGPGNHSIGSMTDKSFLKEGTPAPEGLTAKRVEISARKSPSGSRGTRWLETTCASLSDDTARVSPFNSSRPGVSDPVLMLQETHYPRAPFPDSFMKTWSSLFPDTASYEGCFTQLDSCTNDSAVPYMSVTSSSSSLVFGARARETNFSAMEMSRNVNFSHQPGDAFDNDESAGFFTSNIKEPLIQMSSKDLLKAKPKFPANCFKHSDACNVVSGGAGTANSAEGSSETFDQFNPVVDSPCWKGAPASHQSPFGITEVVSPYFHVEEFEGCNSSSLGVPHILAVNADGAVAASSQKKGVNTIPYENENGEDGSSSFSKEMSSVNFLCVEDELKDSVKAAHYQSEVNIENEILCSDVIQELTQPRKEHFPSIYSKSSELKPSHMKQMSYGTNIASAKLFASEATVVDSGMDIKDLGQDGSSCIQSNAAEHSSSLPFSLASIPVGLAKQSGGASDTRPMIDIQLLVNAMHNLSELLLSSCSNDVEALKEQDHEVICRVVNNLDACLSKKGGLIRSMPQIQLPESSTCCLRQPTDPQKVTWTCRSQVNSVEAVDVSGHNDLEGKMHCGQQDNKLQDFVSMDSETGIKIDNDTSLVMKKIMEEKFGNEQQQTILFKNLWLEAEAALCSVKYEARYARMKIEMENCERDQEKGVAGEPIDTVGQLSRCVSHDPIVDDMLTQGMEEITLPEATTPETIPTGVASQAKDFEAPVPCQAEDSEASVMSRFRILKCHVENCSSMNEGHPTEATGNGAYAGMEDTLSSPCLNGIENIRIETQPVKVVDGNSSERINPSPFIIDRSEDGHLEVTIRLDMQHHGTNCTEDKIELDSYFPWQHDPLKEFGVCISEEPVNALIPNKDGNQSIGDGFDSPSSDWEHVLKEDLKWQN